MSPLEKALTLKVHQLEESIKSQAETLAQLQKEKILSRKRLAKMRESRNRYARLVETWKLKELKARAAWKHKHSAA